MMTRPLRLVPVVLALVLAAGCSRGGSPGGRAARSGAPGDTALVPVTAARLRELAAAPGAEATVLNIWATWCLPCREEFPYLLQAARRHPGVRLLLVSADFEDQKEIARVFLAEHGVTDTTYFKAEPDQAFIDGIDSTWAGALPATVVFDASGRAVAFWEGAADSARFEAAISKALHTATPEGASR
jgi:thiol-disulfide isomerase/thioredoxin